MTKAIVTVIGKDRVGIIAEVSVLLAGYGINILDISQTVLQDYFTMVMLVDVGKMDIPFPEVKAALSDLGEKLELSIRIQHEDIFRSMHQL
ncbi:MAG: ACT domain-containing protein [Clostridiales bacterium]|nr:ACT domain-containing protein [Clostridiales bacterium]